MDVRWCHELFTLNLRFGAKPVWLGSHRESEAQWLGSQGISLPSGTQTPQHQPWKISSDVWPPEASWKGEAATHATISHRHFLLPATTRLHHQCICFPNMFMFIIQVKRNVFFGFARNLFVFWVKSQFSYDEIIISGEIGRADVSTSRRLNVYRIHPSGPDFDVTLLRRDRRTALSLVLSGHLIQDWSCLEKSCSFI